MSNSELDLAKFKANVLLTLGAVISGFGVTVLYTNTEIESWEDVWKIFSLNPDSPLITNGLGMTLIGASFIFGTYFWIRRKIRKNNSTS